MSPPIPVEVGSVTLRAAATATAASAALPPRDRISTPAAAASGCDAATMPPRQETGERRDAKAGSGTEPPVTEQVGKACRRGTTAQCCKPGLARDALPLLDERRQACGEKP